MERFLVYLIVIIIVNTVIYFINRSRRKKRSEIKRSFDNMGTEIDELLKEGKIHEAMTHVYTICVTAVKSQNFLKPEVYDLFKTVINKSKPYASTLIKDYDEWKLNHALEVLDQSFNGKVYSDVELERTMLVLNEYLNGIVRTPA
ncbi:MAG: hypothetical protein PHU24_08360 [Sphaerochaetaceae bacterium]|jgi:preprotein translocase subunit YajC|nr:hypothetical protein [Sphaerochaetaceae bacterium]NLO59895.1 hypothetical protein [Spirochaetales bacterium]MDD2406453.1 hypothetical protein [Sphaerochaetaceae bacterium]MDD4260352.1 hypothetical protein [Sphaerochaetaceae bacterium]MDD4841822.1 hypothetical protein [Sphaerochaetaceae bacterium]